MARSANIFSKDWCNIVFEFKNKEYGAYKIRKESDRRHMISIICGTLLFSLAVSAPTILKNILPDKKKGPNDEKVTMVAIDNKKEIKKVEEKEIKIEVEQVRKSIQFVIPKADATITEEDTVKTQKELNKDNTLISTQTNLKGDTTYDPGILDQGPAVIEEVEQVYDLAGVEEQPSFPGGMDKLREFLGSNIQYPEYEASEGIQGKVYVEFVVGKDGKIRDIKIAKSVSVGLDAEALRVVKLMPAWNPGKQNGRPVSVKYHQPINFKLSTK